MLRPVGAKRHASSMIPLAVASFPMSHALHTMYSGCICAVVTDVCLSCQLAAVVGDGRLILLRHAKASAELACRSSSAHHFIAMLLSVH